MSKRMRETIARLRDCIKKDIITSVILSAAFLLYMIVIVPSGSRYCFDGACGIYFWGAHEHDALWHLALIEHAFRTWPFSMPIYAGHTLAGYNFLLDIIIYVLTLPGISASFLYFKIQPITWFVVFAYLLGRLTQAHQGGRGLARWLYFIVFFSVSFGILIRIFKHGTWLGSVGVPTMQGALGMTNPQFMWSLCVLLALILILRGSRRTWWMVGPLLFIGLGLKFYFIIPAVIFIAFYTLAAVIHRHFRSTFILLASAFLGIAAAYLMFYHGSAGGGLIWKPLELVHQIVEDKDMWYSEVMVQERYYIQQLGHMFSPRLWWIEARTIFYFLFFNFGIRLIAVVGIIGMMIAHFTRHKHLLPFVISIVVATLIPILFIQKGIWWNSIQFLYYAIFLASIVTAEFFWRVTSKLPRLLVGTVVVMLILMFLPTNIEMVHIFTRKDNVSYISDTEIEALTFLKSLPDGVVMTDAFVRRDTGMLPDIYDTAYISAFSGKQMYIANETQLTLLQIPHVSRLALLQEDACALAPLAHYVYVRKGKSAQLEPCMRTSESYMRLFDNTDVSIWQNSSRITKEL
ncbi:MAG TPA: hypothetical protein PKJ68_05285 [Candidatus Woesebacteria bacterium]|nr:hypothetical protein [Candidatus Woesebacteria bacterium]